MTSIFAGHTWTAPPILASVGLGHSRQSRRVVFFLARISWHLMTESSMPWMPWVPSSWLGWPQQEMERNRRPGKWGSDHWRVIEDHHRSAKYLIESKVMPGHLPGIPISAPVISNTCPVHADVSRVLARSCEYPALCYISDLVSPPQLAMHWTLVRHIEYYMIPIQESKLLAETLQLFDVKKKESWLHMSTVRPPSYKVDK